MLYSNTAKALVFHLKLKISHQLDIFKELSTIGGFA